ncbi:MAG: DUF2203 domain-containing protein [Deltaproteobacteria bacterium]|nr:DUF2203 domain-containing protein [Deltaproteobacteria bacterium]
MSELKTGRYFTPNEANELLPEVVGRLDAIGKRLREARELARKVPAGDAAEAEAVVRAQLHQLQKEVEGLLDQINAAGVLVKGVAPGLLDFPALRNGQEVFLCWREGEGRVENWHPIHTGFTGRKEVDFKDFGVWEWCH